VDFDKVTQDDCMHDLAVKVSDDVMDKINDLYSGLYAKSEALSDGLPNVVLAGLTLSWLQCVYNVFGSASYESAVTLLRSIRPTDRDTRSGMRHAAHDFLRRSGWNRRAK